MRFAPTRHTIVVSEPFSGQGVSLYVSIGNTVQYRKHSMLGSCLLRGSERDIGGVTTDPKTERVAFELSPVTTITFPEDPAWLSQTISVDIRTFKDGVENETVAPRQITLDGSGDSVSEILGTATLLEVQIRDGGVVRIRFLWEPSLSGIQPTEFRLVRVSGPSSPSAVVYAVTTGTAVATIEIDTAVLLDSSGYVFKITAANGATIADVLTGIAVQADATGPSEPTAIIQEW